MRARRKPLWTSPLPADPPTGVQVGGAFPPALDPMICLVHPAQRGAGSARSAVEVVAEELGPSLRWAAATTTRATRSQDR
jgi:hypothetical protein